MYLLTNVMKNLIRNKGRNILISVIMLAIIVPTVVAMTINNAVTKVIDAVRLEIGSWVEPSVSGIAGWSSFASAAISVAAFSSLSASLITCT